MEKLSIEDLNLPEEGEKIIYNGIEYKYAGRVDEHTDFVILIDSKNHTKFVSFKEIQNNSGEEILLQNSTKDKIFEIIENGKESDFEIYTIIQNSFEDLKKEINNEKLFNEYIEYLSSLIENHNSEKIETDINNKLKELGFEGENKANVIKKTKKLYISILRIIANQRKQERLKAGSHRGIGYGKQLEFETLERVLKTGVQKLELDIQTTKDGELVVSHDGKVRTQDGKILKIGESNYEDIEGSNLYEGGIEVGEVYKLEKIFKLLEKYPDSVKVTLEIKSKATTEKLKELLEQYSGVKKKIYISSFDGNSLLEAHKFSENVPKVYHSFITKANIDSVIKGLEKFRDNQMQRKKGFGKKIVLGGNQLPDTEEWIITAMHSEIPEEILLMLKISNGFLTLQTVKALGNKIMDTTFIGDFLKKIGINLSRFGTLPQDGKIEKLQSLLKEIGIKSLVYDPFDHELGNKNIDELYSNSANATSYPRTRK